MQPISGLLEFLTAQPGVMESPATTGLGKNQAICCALRAFSGENGGAQPNPKTVGFNLDVAIHQNHLEGPAL